MKKESLIYKVVYIILLIGMIGHLTVSHAIADGWIICNMNNDIHLENVNLSANCHTKTDNNSIFSSNCNNDIVLEHQDEFYSNIRTLEIKLFPVSKFYYGPETENNLLLLQYVFVNHQQNEALPLSLKNSVILII